MKPVHRKCFLLTMSCLILICGWGAYTVRQTQLNNALLKAVSCNNYMDARRLLDEGANPNAQLPEKFWDRVAISLALQRGHPLIFNALFNAYDEDPGKHEDLRMLRLLLDCGADANALDYDGRSAITYFAHEDLKPDWPIIQMLIEHGANPTPVLSLAIDHGNYDLVKLSLEKGADPNHIEDFGLPLDAKYPPLLEAIEDLRPDILKLLLEHGAKTDRCGWKFSQKRGGYCPVTLAQALNTQQEKDRPKFQEILHLLKQYGAKL